MVPFEVEAVVPASEIDKPAGGARGQGELQPVPIGGGNIELDAYVYPYFSVGGVANAGFFDGFRVHYQNRMIRVMGRRFIDRSREGDLPVYPPGEIIRTFVEYHPLERDKSGPKK